MMCCYELKNMDMKLFFTCNNVILTLMCMHHFTFGSYQIIAQLLNNNKMNLLALYNNIYLIGYLITIVLASFNLPLEGTMDNKTYLYKFYFSRLNINIYNCIIGAKCLPLFM
jgi:hypothetical protein